MTEIDRSFGERWFGEVWNRKRREAVAEMVQPDVQIHDGTHTSRGPEAFYKFFDLMHSTFSDLSITLEGTVAEGDTLCIRWSCSVRHTGDGLGHPATGKQMQTTGMTWVRLKDGKAIEAWQNWDMLGLLQQMQNGSPAGTYIGHPAA